MKEVKELTIFIMIKAANLLNNNEVKIKFIICGNASYLKKRTSDNNNFIFTGWVNKQR